MTNSSGSRDSVSFTTSNDDLSFVPEITHECPECETKFISKVNRVFGGYVEGWCPDCFVDALALRLDVPRLEAIDE